MKVANRVGLLAVAFDLAGVSLQLIWQGSVALVLAGGVLELVAFALTIFAVIQGSWFWLFSLPLNAAAAFIWLLAQGH